MQIVDRMETDYGLKVLKWWNCRIVYLVSVLTAWLYQL
jgi:hypothetical protein